MTRLLALSDIHRFVTAVEAMVRLESGAASMLPWSPGALTWFYSLTYNLALSELATGLEGPSGTWRSDSRNTRLPRPRATPHDLAPIDAPGNFVNVPGGPRLIAAATSECENAAAISFRPSFIRGFELCC